MIFISRHGERADFLKPDFRGTHKYLDTPLTPLGHEQARATGRAIKKLAYSLIEEKKSFISKPKFMIISSPFLRTIETAAGIAETFDSDELYDKSIFVQYGCSEILTWYSYDVMPDIQISKLTPSGFSEKYSIPIKTNEFDEKLFTQVKYPETEADFVSRIQKFYTVLVDIYLKKLAKEGVILIISSHGWAVQEILKLLDAYDEKKPIDYCSLSAICYEKGDVGPEAKVVLAQTLDHLAGLPPKSKDFL